MAKCFTSEEELGLFLVEIIESIGQEPDVVIVRREKFEGRHYMCQYAIETHINNGKLIKELMKYDRDLRIKETGVVTLEDKNTFDLFIVEAKININLGD